VAIDILHFSIDYVKKYLNWLRTTCTVSITTVATDDRVSKRQTLMPTIF